MKKVNENQIKLFMAFLMTLKSVSVFLPGEFAWLYGTLSYVAAAWFAFCGAEGVRHTRNIKRYVIGMYLWGGGMLLGNMVLNTGFGTQTSIISENAFLTLAFGISALAVARYYKARSKMTAFCKLVIIVCLAAFGFMCQSGYIIIPTMLVSYFYYENPNRRDSLLVFLSVLFVLSAVIESGFTAESILKSSQFLFVLVIPFIRMYSGERGRKTWATKYFFYIYYPLQAWVVYVMLHLQG